jgi:hypothetical protein
MAIKPTGNVFFEDEYQQKYEVEWETIGGVLDITTTTFQPYVWGEEAEGFVKNGILFRKGIITIQRQVIDPNPGIEGVTYVIVAEGVSQYEDFIQMNFPCEQGPTDPFTHHFDCAVCDETYIKVLEGSHWADPTDPDDNDAIWGDLNTDGSPLEELTMTGGADILEWTDVWSN